jgi:feruloyl-CoA synthase
MERRFASWTEHCSVRSAGIPTRPVRIARAEVSVRRGPYGVVYLESTTELARYPLRITEPLEHWAAQAPDRTFLAQRDEHSGWRSITYADALTRVRRIAQALLDRGLSQERPLLILSGNSIEHALLALAAMHVGILYAPIAPAYSLQARDYTTLRQIFERVEPGLVFAADGTAFERALEHVLPLGVDLIVSSTSPTRLAAAPFAVLEQHAPTPAVDAACDRVGPDTIAKILFTSGSTGRPKGVINTQRMLCSNQEMIRTVMQFLTDEPPVLCDWLPWNHTAGGNHNFGLVLYNGGTFYIDEGRPVPGAIETTVRNLREVAATAHFTVPRTYEALMPFLRTDAVLRARFFSKLKIFFYAAAGLSQKFFDDMQALAVDALGAKLLWVTGLGATETAPFALCTGQVDAWAGFVGFPVPGLELKLAPVGEKIEARVRGPNVTPGYWRDEAMTRAAFDDEGFYRMGDAMRLVDPGEPAKGLLFDGRLAEDFKLSSATWVSVGPLRTRILAHAGGYVQDVVIAGHDRDFAAALVFPNLHLCRALCPDLQADTPIDRLVADPRVRGRFQEIFDALARDSTGSSTFVQRALLLADPASIDAREITDKGSLNQKAVLQHRAALVEELYADKPSPQVIMVALPPDLEFS